MGGTAAAGVSVSQVLDISREVQGVPFELTEGDGLVLKVVQQHLDLEVTRHTPVSLHVRYTNPLD